MKHLSLSFIVMALCATASAQNSIVIRFTASSPEASAWINQGRTGELASLLPLIGPHRTSGYVADATLQAVRKAHRTKHPDAVLQSAQSTLERIVVVTPERTIDPAMISRKLSARRDVVYAEPLPQYEIIAAPNDPLASSQYHLAKVRAIDAWDLLADRAPIVIGIVDTGIDTTHEDITTNVWHNAGEVGLDASNRDRRSNGIDDDGNGFVDDWFGWDFVGADGISPDNSPLPGHPHGTHVGGIVAAVINNNVGVAGVGDRLTVMAVKVGRDSPSSRSVEKTGDGILYAAAAGASVINCSFGSSSRSFADIDVINEAVSLGALVVAAAGNEGIDQVFYPAGHPNTLSVAATDGDDERTYFSNINATVDVAAPGQSILSTVTGGGYEAYDGTSMSSPIVAAIAGMTKLMQPSLTPDQLRAMVKANTDNIDSINPTFVGRMGSGRVNAVKSVQSTVRKFAEISSYAIEDRDGDSIFSPGDQLSVSLRTSNLLDPLVFGRIEVTPAPSTFQPILDVTTADLGPMATNDTIDASNALTLTLPTSLALNADLSLLVTIYDGDTIVGRDYITTTVNPSYRTIADNLLRTTVNSVGNIGYNDYPENIQGVGFQYRNNRSYLFEGAFLIGISPTHLPNVARGANPSYRDNSFKTSEVVRVGFDVPSNSTSARTVFTDSNERYNLGVRIQETVLQPRVDTLRSTIYVIYDVTNITDTTIDGIHTALFMDWDLGEAGEFDGCAWDRDHGMGILQNTKNPSLPTIGVAMLSPFTQQFYAIDNGGDAFTPSIYDHFLRNEKWLMMSSGIGRANSRITDVSVMTGAGPFTLDPGATQQIVFAITADDGYTVATEQMDRARNAAVEMDLNVGPYVPLSMVDQILWLDGGPAVYPGAHELRFELSASSPVTIDIVDLMGRSLGIMVDELNLLPGVHQRSINIPVAANGAYFIRMATYFGVATMPIQIVP